MVSVEIMFIASLCSFKDRYLYLGMWQVSGAHGFSPSKYEAVADMARYVNDGYTTFDLADIYGPAGKVT